jgi:glyoxylate carboligase
MLTTAAYGSEMATASSRRVGVLVMRTWVESGQADGLRVRITAAIDGRDATPIRGVAATIEDACAIVQEWLENFLLPPTLGDGDAE